MNKNKAANLVKAYSAITKGRVKPTKENECERCSDITDLYVDNVSDLAPSYICLKCWSVLSLDARGYLANLKRKEVKNG